METFIDIATFIQLILCFFVTGGIAFALSINHFPILFRWPLCFLGAGSVIYGMALLVHCWPIVRIGQIIESVGISGLILGLVYITIKGPKFHHG